MNFMESYLYFCRRFHKSRIPKLKFKELNDRYKSIYNNYYDISEDDIYKASFIIFLISLSFFIIFSTIFSFFHILIIFFYSFLFSLILSYKFSVYLLNEIQKNESIINAMLYLIKIDFSLIQKSLKKNSDYCINFIKLIKNYNLPISDNFKEILRRTHEGELPEKVLMNILTPSEDFNRYLKDLLTSNFNNESGFVDFKDNTLERNFKIYLRDIESKLSIIFFIGLFFPIGSCFLIILQEIKSLSLIFIIPLYFIIIRYLSSKFLNEDIKLLGILSSEPKNNRREFNGFLLFLKNFAIMLSRKTSPEDALYYAYKKTPTFFQKKLEHPISLLIKNSISIKEMLDSFIFNLKSPRCKLILNVVKKMIHEDTYHTANKIWDLLEIISMHQKLEKRKRIIIKGEKFKSLIFIFLLPFILGVISGVFPSFFYHINLLNNPEFTTTIPFYNNFDSFDLILIFGSFLLSNIISGYYFSKIIGIESKIIIIFTSNLFFVLIFIIILSISLNFVNILNFM